MYIYRKVYINIYIYRERERERERETERERERERERKVWGMGDKGGIVWAYGNQQFSINIFYQLVSFSLRFSNEISMYYLFSIYKCFNAL